jgi:hypothetical protein
MAFVLAPEMLKASYDLLCTTPPFNRWNLPDSDDIVFKIDRDKKLSAWQTFDGIRHVICVSIACVSTVDLLNRYMAHEMVHVHEANVRIDRNDVEHSAAWRKWAAQVCKIHGYDPMAF